MKKIALIALALMMIAPVFAEKKTKTEDNTPMVESVLSGKVIDQLTGEELVGVAVKLHGTETVCYTDFEGNFEFSKLQPGKYKLNVEMISYKEVLTQNIDVRNNELHELKIQLAQGE
ncbi:carboxypeptidase-like regulatory domain-containing protein [Roseimarinus sediminis]|jgi:hypothetical protein|uniref:carboxypeptidase-like regulatory domain-containing protein n=1 Tax=Roseimarinus sediminis TaxID=1610899 RepID=UPI003D2030B3